MTRFCHKMNVPKSPSKITRYHNNPLSKNPPICPEGFKWSLITYDQFCYYLANYYLTLLVLCDIIYFCFWDDEYSNNLLEDNLRWPAPSPDGCWFFIIQITFLVNARKIFPFRGFSIYWRVLEIMKRFKIFSTYRFNLKLTSIKKHILTIFWAMVFFFKVHFLHVKISSYYPKKTRKVEGIINIIAYQKLTTHLCFVVL